MATTPNFNWSTPDNTGLVKNGALDIRTLGNSIDASLVDLKGGTTGQVLSKASNTDMDFTWTADAAGIPATIIDAKGDLIAATAADTPARLAVGTNGQVLTADSTASTGLAWAAPVSGWTSFTPTFTNLTLGNGSVTAAYRENNGLIDISMQLIFGSTTTISSGARFNLPVNLNSQQDGAFICGGRYLDSGVRSIPTYAELRPNYVEFRYAYINFNGSGVNYEIMANVNATEPWTWTTNDQIIIAFSYRKA